MGIRRFTYTLRADVADEQVVKLAQEHAKGLDEEILFAVEYTISESHPVVQWGQLYYTITITFTWEEFDNL